MNIYTVLLINILLIYIKDEFLHYTMYLLNTSVFNLLTKK